MDEADREWEREHETLRRRAQAALARIGLLQRFGAELGIETRAVREANALVEELNAREYRRENLMREARIKARDEAYARDDAQKAWESCRSREEEGDRLVREALLDGRDDVIFAVADGHLEEVRERLLKEEEGRLVAKAARERKLDERRREQVPRERLAVEKQAWLAALKS
jgi:hypothetical protein